MLVENHAYPDAIRYAKAARGLDAAMYTPSSKKLLNAQIQLMVAYNFDGQDDNALTEMKTLYPSALKTLGKEDSLFQSLTLTYICLLTKSDQVSDAEKIKSEYLLDISKSDSIDKNCECNPAPSYNF